MHNTPLSSPALAMLRLTPNCLLALALLLIPLANARSLAQPPETPLRNLLTNYCIECHGPDEQQASRRFDTLPLNLPSDADTNQLAELQDILDQLNLGAMPPEDAQQPNGAERRGAVRYLTQQITAYHAARSSSQEPTLRRRNNREYRNALRDLLKLDITMFDPVAGFPRDATVGHLDNIADALVTSGFLLDRYLDAADTAIDKILALRERPSPRSWHFSKDFRQQPEIDQVHGKTNRFDWLTLYDVVGADKHEGAYAPILAFSNGVPTDGYYEIEFLAEAVNREHPYDDDFLSRDRNELLRLGIRPGNQAAGPLHKPQPIEPLLAEFDLADEKKWYRTKLWLDEGYTPRFTFINGLMDARNLWTKLIRRYPDQFPKNLKSGIVSYRFNAIKLGKLPQIHVHEVKISGPHYDSWPLPSHNALLGDDCEAVLSSGRFANREDAVARLHAFASRAFRRPLTEQQAAELRGLYEHRVQSGRSPLDAYADAAKSVLVSPSFLYYASPSPTPSESSVETGAKTPQGQSPQGQSIVLADRLAAFLWSSLPDDELLGKLAADSSPVSIAREVDRMLEAQKSQTFVTSFLDGWLNLRDLGASPPDRSQFKKYYQFGLQEASLTETRMYFRHLIQNDLPPELLLDSDFAFVNKRLADHYNIPFNGPNEFRKVQLPDRRRGGLLGQASVLTVSANGIETSPVVRGIWVLESLLDSPPSPPPPDVPPLDPDTRGAKSIREQLAKHRTNEACNDCHRRIDPPGFALENFDPVGSWRDNYSKRVTIDASGTLPGNRTFDGIVEFKQHLLSDRERFYRGLVNKLMAYAHGRLMTASDRPRIDPIVRSIQDDSIGLRTIIHRVAQTLAD